MNKEILVSIIMPLYNSEKFIGETIKSVQAQTYKNWELICIDDVSTDNTSNLIKEIMSDDSRIKYYKLKENKGIIGARNFAFDKVSGKYMAFLDHDDLWEPNKLEKQVSFMEENDYTFTYTIYDYIDQEGNKLNKRIVPPSRITYKKIIRNCTIGCLTVMVNVEELGFVKVIERRDIRDDFPMWLYYLKKTNGYLCEGTVAQHRLVKNSFSHTSRFNLLMRSYRMYRYAMNFNIFKSLYYTFINGFLFLFRRNKRW